MFFGRDRLLLGDKQADRGLVERVKAQPLVAVIGPSGSGKSSLVFAGLVPELRRNGDWLIESFRPEQYPFYGLASSLVRLLDPNLSRTDQVIKAKTLAEAVKQSGFAELISVVLKDTPGKRLLLIVDQFEELYTLCKNSEEQRKFISSLLGALTSTRLTLILTLRADFLGNLLSFPSLRDALQQFPPQLLSPMSPQELQEAIEKPAKYVGIQLESGLSDQILEDLGDEPGNLPLLQFALTRLWEKQQDLMLTHQAYKEVGGVRKALVGYANGIYKDLSESEQKQAQRIFVQLVKWGEGTGSVRQFATRTELGEECWHLITRQEGLADCRLVVTGKDEQTGGEIVEIVHEVLIRKWEQLREWVNNHQVSLTQKHQIETLSHEWQTIGKPADLAYLLQGSKLVEAEDLSKELDSNSTVTPLSDTAKNLIEESRKLHNKRLVRRWIGWITIPSIIICALLFSWQQHKQKQYAQVIADTSVGIARPELLPISESLLQQAEELADQDRVEDALKYYRITLNFTYLLQKQVQQNPKNFPTEISVHNVLKQAEEGLTILILDERLPGLKSQLEGTPESEIGEPIIPNDPSDIVPPDPSKFADQRFTPGALHTTYAILMTDFGVKADLNNDGSLTNKEEAERIPCPLLIELEKLWRDATNNACGFYNASETSTFGSPECVLLENQSLTELVLSPSYMSAVDRLNFCKLATRTIEYQ